MKAKLPIISLIILSLLAGLIWRLEVEYHGWTGLIWISYFHLAIPIGFGLFLLWANCFIALSLVKRILLNAITVIFGILLYDVLATSLTYIFIGGPSAFILHMSTPKWLLNLIRFSIFLIIPSIPIGTYLILKIFKKAPHWKFLILAMLGIIISIPLSVLILDLINHKGNADLIHIIKSGMLIPFWVFSLGLLIIGQRAKEQKSVPKKLEYE